jgi:4-aminobutyrate aminotransferase-like enzyme
LVHGEDVWVTDSAGQRYLDVYNNVPHVGHCHPRVVEALHKQAGRLNTHSRYLGEEAIAYAERLAGYFASSLDNVAFCCTGTEANELALRLARTATGGTGIIVSSWSYHGNSAGLAALTTAIATPEAFPDHARAIAIPDMLSGARAEHLSAADALASLDAAGVKPAALLIDASFSNEGMPVPPDGFLADLAQRVRDADGLVIADEVQSGFGRTGDAMWSYAAHGITPDIVTLGKPMGNGYPLAAAVCRSDLIERFGPAYFNTFAGSGVAAAVGNAVLDVIEEQALVQSASDVGAYARAELESLTKRHKVLGAVRGRGLHFGIEISGDGTAPASTLARILVERLRRSGILVGRIGPEGNILKMRPPMTFARSHVDMLVHALERGLQEGLPSE